MATSITYSGVPSAEGGNIFNGMSFWIAQRIPMRKHFVDLIETNGGRVVPLEKNADMLIADCGKPKLAPAGSYSWKFIQDSVNNGIAQLQDRYRIGRDPDLPRPVASGGVTRTTRVAFTTAEDASLAKWVLSHSVDRTGNRIFQEYEAMNPRHTWQSWRNRYVKILAPLPMEKLEQLAASAPTEEQRHVTRDEFADRPSATETGSINPRDQQSEHQLLPKKSNASRSNQQNPNGRSDLRKAQTEAQHQPRLDSRELSPLEESQLTDDAQGLSQFHHDFTDFMQLQGLDAQFEVQIGSRVVKLWGLLQAVEGQKVPPEEVDWIKVAEELGYDWAQSREATAQLRQCYEENLLPFLDAMDDYSSEDDVDRQADNEDANEGLPLPRQRSPSYVPSSPPAEFTRGKRPLDLQADISTTNKAKRRRLNRGVEIPSTPEEELKGIAFSNNILLQSPSLRRSKLQQNQIPDSEASQQLPPLPRVELKTTEPETQDFQMEETQPISELLAHQESFDMTPSQQLQSEQIDATPIPFQLDPGHRDQRTSSDEAPSPSAQQDQASRKPESKLDGSLSLGLTATSTPTRPKSTKTSKRSLPASFTSPSTRNPGKTLGRERDQTPAETKAKSSSTEASNLDEISRWVEHYEALGYSNRIVVEAFKRTTMIPGGLAGIVMQSLQEGKGVPPNHEGIWSDRDDNGLRQILSMDLEVEPQDAQQAQQLKKAKKEYGRLINKHGVARFELRKKFLELETVGNYGARHG